MVIYIVLVTTTKHLNNLEEKLELFEFGGTSDTQNVVHGHGAGGELDKHDLQNVEKSKDVAIFGFRHRFTFLNERHSEVRQLMVAYI